jgi:hypothetical protein
MSKEGLPITGVTGKMRGTIGLSLPPYICILQSMRIPLCHPSLPPFPLFRNVKSACKVPASTRISKNGSLAGNEDFAYRSYSILPALAFSLDMFVKTNNSYGVNEVLLASVLGCVVFSLLAAQPLVIVGVTGEYSTHPT